VRPSEFIRRLRAETGIDEGCPLCGGFLDASVNRCEDCGTDLWLEVARRERS